MLARILFFTIKPTLNDVNKIHIMQKVFFDYCNSAEPPFSSNCPMDVQSEDPRNQIHIRVDDNIQLINNS